MKVEKVDAENVAFNSLLQNYEKEFSSITKKVPDPDGTFNLDVNLNETDNFLLIENREAIGFCVKGFSEGRHDISEFFVILDKRHNKIGRKFAQEVFKKYKGEWQVRQIEGADKAITFWRKVIAEFTKNDYQESVVEDEYWGKVTRQIFKSL